MGNFIRSRELYNFLKDKKIKTDFILYNEINKIKKKYNFIIIDLPRGKYFLSLLKKFKYDKKSKFIGLDYTQRFKIHINISLFIKCKYAEKNFLGYKYAIINRDIIDIKKINNTFNNNMLISIGSSDIQNISEKIKKKADPYFKKVLINKKTISEIKNKKQNFNYYKFISQYHNIACNAGTTLLEMLYLNKNIFSFPQNKDELRFAKYLKKQGFVFEINKFNFNQKKIYPNENKIKIDRFGLNRIYNIIKNLSE